jgi:hypothetical protein
VKWVTPIFSLPLQFRREKPIWHLPGRKVTAISSPRKLIAGAWNAALALGRERRSLVQVVPFYAIMTIVS